MTHTPKTITLDISVDLQPFVKAMEDASRALRAWAARVRGQKHLARVITEQPGRRIVREGLADVLEWLGETP